MKKKRGSWFPLSGLVQEAVRLFLSVLVCGIVIISVARRLVSAPTIA